MNRSRLNRLDKVERSTGKAAPIYVWKNFDETHEDALKRVGIKGELEHVCIVSWQD